MDNKQKIDQEFESSFVQKKAGVMIKNSFDLKRTKSRIINVTVFGAVVIIFMCYMGFVRKDFFMLSILSLVYVVITIFEKVNYGFGVIAYKKVIQKIIYDDEYRNNQKRKLKEEKIIE